MEYTIKAHPTMFDGVQYRSRLEARWAAFFTLLKWEFQYEPFDLPDWVPDFRVVVSHPDFGTYKVLAEVKPYYIWEGFNGHALWNYIYAFSDKSAPGVDTTAGFGISPEVAFISYTSSESGGGVDALEVFLPDNWESLWKQAGNLVQWKGPQR
jgi:hypothetical protein